MNRLPTNDRNVEASHRQPMMPHPPGNIFTYNPTNMPRSLDDQFAHRALGEQLWDAQQASPRVKFNNYRDSFVVDAFGNIQCEVCRTTPRSTVREKHLRSKQVSRLFFNAGEMQQHARIDKQREKTRSKKAEAETKVKGQVQQETGQEHTLAHPNTSRFLANGLSGQRAYLAHKSERLLRHLDLNRD